MSLCFKKKKKRKKSEKGEKHTGCEKNWVCVLVFLGIVYNLINKETSLWK